MSTQQRWILCGGLASGKSTVRRLLDEAGIATIDADAVGHEVLEPDGAAFPAVAQRWPEVVRAGEIDRSVLAGIVFGDSEALAELESITHPHIFDTIRWRVEEITGPVVVEMPLLKRPDEGWRRLVVDCRDDAQLTRALERGMAEEDARARLASQPDRSTWLAAADVVIPNHGEVGELRESVRALTGHL